MSQKLLQAVLGWAAAGLGSSESCSLDTISCSSSPPACIQQCAPAQAKPATAGLLSPHPDVCTLTPVHLWCLADAFSSASSCRTLPTAANSKPDSSGHLWGQANGAACAYKDAAGHALFYTNYEPGSWLHTPPCSMPAFSDNSVADSKLRVRKSCSEQQLRVHLQQLIVQPGWVCAGSVSGCQH